MGFPFRKIEKKWRKYWSVNDINKTNTDDLKNKLYCLVMFSYPSADKLHLGHWFNYSPVDTWARFKRMQGYHIFEPMGYDAFGLPAENYAIKKGLYVMTQGSDGHAEIINGDGFVGKIFA